MVRVDAGGRSGRTAAVAKPSRSDFALKVALGNSYAARHSGVLRLVSATQPLSVGGLFWRTTQGSPALRANSGLNDGIPLGFVSKHLVAEKVS